MDRLRDQLSEIKVQWIKDFQNPINAKAVFTLGAWAPAQSSDAFRHVVLQRPKYHLLPEYKVEGIVPEFLFE